MKASLLLTLTSSALGSAVGVDPAPIEPSLSSVRNAVFTLVRGGDHGLDALIESHRCLHEAIDDLGSQYDHIVFHEDNLEPEALADAVKSLPDVRFVSIADAFVLPAGVQLPADVISGAAEGSVGYRHMCHFMSMQWYQLLSRYEYAMRVDEDVCLQTLVADPFRVMQERKLVYGYGRQTIERHQPTLDTFPAWLDKYVEQQRLLPLRDTHAVVENMFFTNFFIARVAWWERADVQHFLKAVDESGRIYTKRWGDAPIQTVALALFASPEAVSWIPTKYLHVSTMNGILLDGTEIDGYRDQELISHPLTHAFHRELELSFNDTNSSPPPITPPLPPTYPPVYYSPLEPEVRTEMEPAAIIGLTIALILLIVILALVVLIGTNKPLDCSPVSQSGLGQLTFWWGRTSAKYFFVFAPALLIVYLCLACVGLPQVEQDRGSTFDWVPAGTRFYNNLKEWDTYVDNSITDRTTAYFMVMSDNEGENLLDDPQRWLNATLYIAQQAYAEAVVTADDKYGRPLNLSWPDFCFSVNHPILVDEVNPSLPGTGDRFKPCMNPSVLDPFREGMWEFDGAVDVPGVKDTKYVNDALKKEKYKAYTLIQHVATLAGALNAEYGGQINDQQRYESFYDLNRTQIIGLLEGNSNCGDPNERRGHWINAASQPWGKLYGGFRGYNHGAGGRQLEYVRSFVYTMYQDIPAEVIHNRNSVKNMTADSFRDANAEWLLALEKVLEKINDDEVNYPGVRVTFFPSNGIERMYEEVASAQTSTIVIGYCCMFAFVLLSQISFRKKHLNLIFVGGVGFIFILVGNAAAYGIIAIAGVKFNHTMLQALPFLALGLGVDDLFLLLHAFRQVMSDHKGSRRDTVVALTYLQAGASVTITSMCNAAVFFASCIIPITALRYLLVSCGLVVLFNWLTSMILFPALFSLWGWLFEDPSQRDVSEEAALAEVNAKLAEHERALKDRRKGNAPTDVSPWSPQEMVTRVYLAMSNSLAIKLSFLAVGLGLLIGFAALIPKVEIGYKETDLAKRGSYLGEGINDIFSQVFSQHQSELVVFGKGIDYTVDQRIILDTHQTLSDSNWSAYGTLLGRCGTNANTWLENMYTATGICPYFNATGDGTDPGWAFYEDLHLWRQPQVWLTPRYPVGNTQYLAFGGIFAGLLDRANSWPYEVGPENETAYFSADNKLILSWDEVELDMTRLNTTESKIQMVRDFKKITEDSGLNIYNYGYLYIQIEQFLNLDYYFWQAAAVSMAAVFVLSLLFGISWLGSGLIGLLSIAICLQVYGSLYALDINYQTLACTSMLISIGISVEFVAHPVAAYEFASGTREDRMLQAMSHTGLPVLEGALSSVLGFVFLAASDFDFVLKYFFYIFLMICIFGAANGLILLPSLLALFGPSKEFHETKVMSPGRYKPQGSSSFTDVTKEGFEMRSATSSEGVTVAPVATEGKA